MISDGTTSKRTLHIGTYNVWLMHPLVTFFAHRVGIDISPRKMTRAKLIPEVLPENLDVLVLCEAFCARATDELCRLLKERHGLVYRTHILGSRSNICASGKLLSGGVVIVSKFPLDIIEEQAFGSICARDDSLADKGFLYVKFQTDDGLAVNIFATHTQAWDEPKCKIARCGQIGKLREFIVEKDIPENEVVLIVGDLNVPREDKEYEDMLALLNSFNPNQTDLENPSFNHISNVLASKGPSSGGTSTTVDYILVSKEHVQPTEFFAEVLPLKANKSYDYKGRTLDDLSDHYPVFGKFVF